MCFLFQGISLVLPAVRLHLLTATLISPSPIWKKIQKLSVTSIPKQRRSVQRKYGRPLNISIFIGHSIYFIFIKDCFTLACHSSHTSWANRISPSRLRNVIRLESPVSIVSIDFQIILHHFIERIPTNQDPLSLLGHLELP